MSLEVPPQATALDYVGAFTALRVEFAQVGGVVNALTGYTVRKQESEDFYWARHNLYRDHLSLLDEPGERPLAKAAMKGFVLQEMVSEKIHPPLFGRTDRIGHLFKDVSIETLQAELGDSNAYKTGPGRLKAAEISAKNALRYLGRVNNGSIIEWGRELVPQEEHRRAFVSFFGATLHNSHFYHDALLTVAARQKQAAVDTRI